ncbi:MAG: YjfB family protein [Methylococcaceae bacterium]|jgi:hypothetical protein
MVDSVNGVANVAISLQQQKLSQDVGTAVLSKAKQIQEQQGQAALQLLESAKVPQKGIDVRA